ncbi:MAG: putative ABC transporter substrate binding protein [Chloroflexi bacterium OLB13]|nr:MAG: putative ABC transporter substrate binding protein [Chloroflexi bacterium OLB13]
MAANIEGAEADAAWAVVNFLTNDEGALSVAESSFGPMPTRMSAAEAYIDSWVSRTADANVDAHDFNAFIAGSENSHRWQLPVGYGPFVDAFNAGLEQAFTGAVTVDDMIYEVSLVAEEIHGG